MPTRNVVVLVLACLVSLACYQKAERNRYAATVVEAIEIIADNYVDEVDPHELFENALDGMVEGLDPYSSFISAEDFRQFQQDLDQEFGGVGIMVEMNQETKRLTVLSPLVDTPAYRAGVRAGDIILEIDGESTVDLSLKDAVRVIQGKPGTPVTLTIQHAGDEETLELTIERAKIPVKSILGDRRNPDGSWQFYLEEHPEIGYIRMTSFGERTVTELQKAISTYANHPIDGLIIDLRNNAGGLLKAAVSICDMFLDEGQIVSTRGRDGVVRESFSARTGVSISGDLPVVILTNRFSASASEILAACLQDHGRATIIGERTWGKGTVQNVIEMEAGRSALKLTTARYSRPSGENIHRQEGQDESEAWGVRPSDGFEVKLTDEQFERVLEYRRTRDVFRTTPAPPEDDPSAGEGSSDEESETDRTDSPPPTSEESATPEMPPAPENEAPEDAPTSVDEGKPTTPADSIVDPQLHRAVEFLLKTGSGE